MFNRTATNPEADKARTRAYVELSNYPTTSEEYATILQKIEALEEIHEASRRRSQISPDTKALIAANLTGIVMVLGYEKANIITSKAFGMLLRPQQ